MKRKAYFMIVFVMAFMHFIGTAQNPTIAVTASTISIEEGESTTLTATLSAISATEIDVVFSVTGTAVLDVDYSSDSKQVIMTAAGTGISGLGAIQLNSPQGIAFDIEGNMYVVDGNNSRIQKFTRISNGIFNTTGITVAGTGISGSGANQLKFPCGVAFDAIGNMYVIDRSNNRIQKFTKSDSGVFNTAGITVAGTGISGSGANQLKLPSGVSFDAAGNMYVVDNGNNRIQKFPTIGVGIFNTTGTTVIGTGISGSGSTQLNSPLELDFDASGNMYVVDSYNYRIQKFAITDSGKFNTTGITVAGTGVKGSEATQLSSPGGVVFNALGDMYVADMGNYRIQEFRTIAPGVFKTTGRTVAGTGTSGSGANQFYPAGVDLDAAGNLYVTDYYNHRIQEYPLGKLKITIPAGSTTGSLKINALINDVSVTEETETVVLTPQQVQGATLVDINPITVSILDKKLGVASNQLLVVGLYPNPVKDYMMLEMPENYDFKYFEVYNLLGQMQGRFEQEKISTENLPNGSYIVKIHTAKGVIVKQIIKN